MNNAVTFLWSLWSHHQYHSVYSHLRTDPSPPALSSFAFF